MERSPLQLGPEPLLQPSLHRATWGRLWELAGAWRGSAEVAPAKGRVEQLTRRVQAQRLPPASVQLASGMLTTRLPRLLREFIF